MMRKFLLLVTLLLACLTGQAQTAKEFKAATDLRGARACGGPLALAGGGVWAWIAGASAWAGMHPPEGPPVCTALN